jgi:hypothetical protein
MLRLYGKLNDRAEEQSLPFGFLGKKCRGAAKLKSQSLNTEERIMGGAFGENLERSDFVAIAIPHLQKTRVRDFRKMHLAPFYRGDSGQQQHGLWHPS